MSPPCWSGCPTTRAGATRSCRKIAPSFTERGYAFVVQDVRGKFRSEGETLAFVHEVDDGYDTLDWMVAQPWCDGNVGMWGDSYYGYTQWAAVASEHPALKAIVPRVTTADLGGVGGGDDPVIPLYLGEYLANVLARRQDLPLDARLRSPAPGGGLRRRVRGDRPARRELRPVRDHERGSASSRSASLATIRSTSCASPCCTPAVGSTTSCRSRCATTTH